MTYFWRVMLCLASVVLYTLARLDPSGFFFVAACLAMLVFLLFLGGAFRD